MKFNIGDKVKFVKGEEGCWKEFAGKTLTVARTFFKDGSTDTDTVQLEEIKESHLITTRRLRIDFLKLLED